MLPRAYSGHQWYKKTFGKDWPEVCLAIIQSNLVALANIAPGSENPDTRDLLKTIYDARCEVMYFTEQNCREGKEVLP